MKTILFASFAFSAIVLVGCRTEPRSETVTDAGPVSVPVTMDLVHYPDGGCIDTKPEIEGYVKVHTGDCHIGYAPIETDADSVPIPKPHGRRRAP